MLRTLEDSNDHSINRYKVKKMIRTNSPDKHFYEGEVWNTRGSGSSKIRGDYQDIIRAFKVDKAKKYGVIPHTIGSIISLRNWSSILI